MKVLILRAMVTGLHMSWKASAAATRQGAYMRNLIAVPWIVLMAFPSELCAQEHSNIAAAIAAVDHVRSDFPFEAVTLLVSETPNGVPAEEQLRVATGLGVPYVRNSGAVMECTDVCRQLVNRTVMMIGPVAVSGDSAAVVVAWYSPFSRGESLLVTSGRSRQVELRRIGHTWEVSGISREERFHIQPSGQP